MGSVSVRVPYQFAASRASLSWREVSYALDRGIFTPCSVVEHALENLSKYDDPCDSLIELASLGKEESVLPFVEELANSEPEQATESIEAKWIYLVLYWIYDNRSSYDDPLQLIEQVYAEFDYPKFMKPFVRYMPSDAPDLGSIEKNTARLYENLHNYLLLQGSTYRT